MFVYQKKMLHITYLSFSNSCEEEKVDEKGDSDPEGKILITGCCT